MKLIVSLLIFWNLSILAQEPIPGLIPRFYSIEAANDLTIVPDKAHKMAIDGEDISLISPKPDTNIWSPLVGNQSGKIVEKELLDSQGEVHFLGSLPSRDGQYRFNIQNEMGEQFVIIASSKVHNFLLRKNILEKIGYKTPAMQWLPNVKINFNSKIDRDIFISELDDKSISGEKRWIRNKTENSISMIDVIATVANNDIYNLPNGIMYPTNHRGRRVLRAPNVAMAMVDTPESVNLFQWRAGRVVLNQVELDHTQVINNGFGTSYEDARWIGRLISKLSRVDLEEVVAKAYYPRGVSDLLVEKIISRRNSLLKLLELNLEQDYSDLAYNPHISAPQHGLLDGEIINEFYEGYVSHYSYGDPESPFSSSEIGSYVLSRLQSEVMTQAVSKFNSYLGSDDQGLLQSKLEDLVKDEGIFHPTKALIVPSVHGNVILSRNIVTGQYQGIDNRVQLVDSFGFALSAGALMSLEGLPAPMSVSASSVVGFQRVYSHVKPIQSLKKSMKEPYKNLIIPMMLNKLFKRVKKLKFKPDVNQTIEVNSIVGEIKASLEVGESFIITDSLAPMLSVDAQVGIFPLSKDMLNVYTGFQSQKMMTSRFHLYRKDENTFHIYQGYGDMLKLSFTVKLRSYVPILGVSAKWNKAKIRTDYYKVDISPGKIGVRELKSLRKAILRASHKPLKDIFTSYTINHKIGEYQGALDFLFFRRSKIGTNHEFTLNLGGNGVLTKVQRRYDAITTGQDFEKYSVESVNSLVSILAKKKLNLTPGGTSNPGFSVFGRAKNKIFSTELLNKELTLSYQRIFNGWKSKKSRLKRLLKKMNTEFGGELIDPLAYLNTKKILLYQISMNVFVEKDGINKLLTQDEKKLLGIILKEHKDVEIAQGIASRFAKKINEIGTLLNQSDKSLLRNFNLMIKQLLNNVNMKTFEEIVGTENIRIQGRVDGFREGDEGGDEPIFSDEYGELPLPLHKTHTMKIIEQIGILPGELFANWATARAI